jgi:lysophospholipase L1-like esterase
MMNTKITVALKLVLVLIWVAMPAKLTASQITITSDNAMMGFSPYVWKCTGTGATARAEATLPGAYLKTCFQGSTTIGLVIDGNANSGGVPKALPVVEYCIDEGPFTVVPLTITSGVYTLSLATGLNSSTQHRLDVYFRAADLGQNRWTASTAHLRIAGIALDEGGALLPRTTRSKLAIAFGDSITEGVGADSLFTSWQILAPNNARGTWFPIVCSGLDCEYGQLGSGGQGMVVSGLAMPPLPQTWDHYDSTTSRLTGGLLLPEPNYVFCFMGTNDPSGQNFTGAYIDWLTSVRQACPNTQIFCITPTLGNGWHAADVRLAVTARNNLGDQMVYLIDTAPLLNGWKVGQGASMLAYDGVHPSLYGHAILGSLIAVEAQKDLSKGNIGLDSDMDGMPNEWELRYGLDPNSYDAYSDKDVDGVINVEEYRNGCDPTKTDTDGDGLTDYQEIAVYHTKPGLSDSDGDGMPDAWEIAEGLNPALSDATGDPDNDGLMNIDEYKNGSKPFITDTDGDGMPDGWEVQNRLNPLVNDAGEDADADGLSNLQEYQRWTDPQKADTDGDGMPDGWEVTYNLNPTVNNAGDDSDTDGLTNLVEYQNNTNPRTADTDSDGMPDGWEVQNRLNPLVNDTQIDNDNDGLLNINEYLAGCNPFNPDSDGDHMPDKWEVDNGLNPIVADGLLDADGDSYSNFVEYLHNSSFSDANSLPLPMTIEVPVVTTTIQTAIDGSINGDTILVKPGRYYEQLHCNGRNITIRSTNPNDLVVVNATVIDGNGLGTVVTFDSGEDANAVLAGLTITGGRSNNGGGIRIYGASPTIENNIIAKNISTDTGGGISCENSSAIIRFNKIYDNHASNWVGGAAFQYADASVFQNNLAAGNEAPYDAGIVILDSEMTVINNTIVANIAQSIDSSSSGIALYRDVSLLPTIKNNIIAFNTGAPAIYDLGNAIAPEKFTFNDVFGHVNGNYNGVADQTGMHGNISVDPRFADANSDYHLLSQAGRWDPNSRHWVVDTMTSACIDAGDPNDDIGEELWPHGRRINMGVYGGTPQASMSLSNVGNVADLNNDHSVDIFDLMQFCELWMLTQDLLAEDLNRNGLVDFRDYAILAGQMGMHE